MTTQWIHPRDISQHAEVEQHVGWTGEENNYVYIRAADNTYLSTKRELLHIANPTTHDLVMKTAFLYLTNFNLQVLPDVISGIEVELEMKRGGRITDETVQLMYDGALIGRNSADYKLDNNKVYGAVDDLWDVDNISSIITDPSFGVALRFQSHPAWPHREHPMINYIRLRVS